MERPGPLPNDPAGGTIGDQQYINWKSNFGKRKGTQDLVFEYTLADNTVKTGTVVYATSASSLLTGSAVVPEPAAAGLLLVARHVRCDDAGAISSARDRPINRS